MLQLEAINHLAAQIYKQHLTLPIFNSSIFLFSFQMQFNFRVFRFCIEVDEGGLDFKNSQLRLKLGVETSIWTQWKQMH